MTSEPDNNKCIYACVCVNTARQNKKRCRC